MSTTMKIDYLEFPANDLDAVEAFYVAVFGWSFEDYGPDYRAFSDGKIDGGFYRAELSSSADDGAALVIFHTEHLEQAQAAVENAGGKIVKPIFSFPGGRRFQFSDPAGNELAVWTKT